MRLQRLRCLPMKVMTVTMMTHLVPLHGLIDRLERRQVMNHDAADGRKARQLGLAEADKVLVGAGAAMAGRGVDAGLDLGAALHDLLADGGRHGRRAGALDGELDLLVEFRRERALAVAAEGEGRLDRLPEAQRVGERVHGAEGRREELRVPGLGNLRFLGNQGEEEGR